MKISDITRKEFLEELELYMADYNLAIMDFEDIRNFIEQFEFSGD